MSNVTITVNGRSCLVDSSLKMLEALQENGLQIPHLCHHPKLPPQGRCGLCLVEVRELHGWSLKHACLLLCWQGLEIRTESSRINQVRMIAAQILLQRGPFNKTSFKNYLDQQINKSTRQTNRQERSVALALAATEVINRPEKARGTEGCILCGLCVSICNKIGRNKLTFLGRGQALRISCVSNNDSDGCGSCRSCSTVCPTGHIQTNGEQTFMQGLYKKNKQQQPAQERQIADQSPT